MSALLNNITRAAWSAIKDGDTPDWHFDAENFLSALAAAGYAVVPVEPTPHMAEEGMRALVRDNGVADIYRTMIAAAKEGQG
jgi:hypothetical protein